MDYLNKKPIKNKMDHWKMLIITLDSLLGLSWLSKLGWSF